MMPGLTTKIAKISPPIEITRYVVYNSEMNVSYRLAMGQCMHGEIIIISLHAKGTFMCPHNASALRDRHIYVPADVVQFYEENSKAKRAFGVSPCLLSSNKCRPHLSTYITLREGRKGRC